MKQIKLGLVGFGQIAETAHLRTLKTLAGVEVVALAESDPQRRQVASGQAPQAALFEDYESMLHSTALDAVIICLPTALHAPASLAAFEHGLHVYLEKPMAVSMEAARQIMTAWQKTDRVGMLGFNYRYNPLYQAARQYLAQGRLGSLVALRTEFSTPNIGSGWRQARATGGGALLEIGSHHIDLIQYLTGKAVSSVFATIRSGRTQDDQVLLQLELADGPVVQASFYTGLGNRDRLEVRGSEAGLAIDRYLSLDVELVDNTYFLSRAEIWKRRLRSLRHLPYLLRKRSAPNQELSYLTALNSFVARISDANVPIPDFKDGYICMQVVAAAELSAQLQRAVLLSEIN
jgi:myo-inositol 2-dehydrogenase / D-chiro-inositol 1-dehydrogenase